jgi:hypothetical protein
MEEFEGNLTIRNADDAKKYASVSKITGNLYISSNVTAELPRLTSITGDLYISSNVTAELPRLTSITGDLYISSKISAALEKRLWSKNRKDTKKKWFVCDLQSEWLLKRLSTRQNVSYYINQVQFPIDLFTRIRSGDISAPEVFKIENLEQRRIAYERMDKTKMKDLANFKVLDSRKKDEQGNPDKIVSFSIEGYEKPFLYYNCLCPSTKREYFVQTDKEQCIEAKNASFRHENIEWVNEW